MIEETQSVGEPSVERLAELHPHCCGVLLRLAKSPTLSPRAMARAMRLKVPMVKWALKELRALEMIQPVTGKAVASGKPYMLTTLGENAVTKVSEAVSARRWLQLTDLQSGIDLLQDALSRRAGE